MMSTELAMRAIKESAELGVNSLKFNGRGESTLHKDFEKITSYAKSLAHGSTFIDRITNSNFNFPYDKESIFLGLCNQTKVKVSFDSFRKEIFEKQRKGSNYENTLANMNKFYNYPIRDNTFVVQAVRTQLNKDEDLEHEIKSRWPEATPSIRDCVEGRINKDLSETIIKKRDDQERQTCVQAHARLVVHWDGRVAPCCPSIDNSLIIGDLNKESVIDVWKSKAAYDLRKSLLDKTAFEKHPCKGCSSFESWAGWKPVWNS